MSPTRVLYLAHSVSASGGGMERVGRDLLTYGDDVEFAVIAAEGLDDLPDDVHTVHLWLPAKPAAARIALFAWRSGRLVRQLRSHVDVVHSCGAITRECVDVATVHLCHAAAPRAPHSGPMWRRLNSSLARFLGRRLERRQFRAGGVTRLVAVSDHVAGELVDFYPEIPRSIIPNGVDVARFLAPPRTAELHPEISAVMVTGDFATKGVELAIRAIAASPDSRLRVVGAGPAAFYEDLARSLSVGERVVFAGYEADPRLSYDASDVVICVSDYESFGLYLVEAALSGCAVISTDVGVASTLIGDGDGGVLIERTPESLAAALSACATDPAGTRERGRVAAERASAFSRERMVTDYVDLYQSLGTRSRDAARVLHVGLESPTTRRGGLNQYLRELVVAQRAAGATVEVVWIASDDSLDATRVTPGLSWPRRAHAFAHTIRRSRADVIDVHFAAHAWWAVLTGAMRRRPYVVHFQGPWALESQVSGDRRLSVWLKARVEGFVLRRADLVVTLSSAFKSVAIDRYHVAPQRVAVIAPGVAYPAPRDRAECRRALGVSENDVVWLAVRRLVRRMGLDLAIDAFARSGTPNGRLVIVGAGPLRDELEAHACAAGVADAVTFTGALDDDALDAWYWAADVSLVPSRAHEGFGLVVLESLARGTPVVASNEGGLRDAAQISTAVRLCSPEPDAIASAVASVLADPTLRERAHLDVARCTWDGVAATHRDWYRRVLVRDVPRGVVVLDHTARASGGELAIARLLSALDHRWQPHVILAEDGPLVAELHRRGISTEVLPMSPRTRNLSRDAVTRRGIVTSGRDTLSYSVRLRRRLHHLRPQIVHSNSMKAHVYGTVVSVGAPWRFVVHVRDRWEPPYIDESVARGLRFLTRHGPDAVIVNSESTARTVRVAATVLASPVEPAFFAVPAPDASDTLRLAVVGRLAPWKGQQLAIDAVAKVAGEFAVHLDIVGGALFGEDDYAADLTESLRAQHLEAVVTLRGHLDDVTPVLAASDATILSSLSPEPFGNVVVEAMAAGRPVIVPNRGGVTEYVIDDAQSGSGYFYEMGDVNSLADAIRRVAGDRADARRRGERARSAADAFRADTIAESLESLYDRLS